MRTTTCWSGSKKKYAGAAGVAFCACSKHYVQAGRQLLLALALPEEVTELARQIARVGLRNLFAADLAARLDA